MVWNKIARVGWFSFVEQFRARILHVAAAAVIGLVFISLVARGLTYSTLDRVTINIALSLCSFLTVGISLFLAPLMLRGEIDSKLVYLMLSRPLKRSEYILGKVFAILLVCICSVTMLTLATIGLCVLHGIELPSLFGFSILFTLLESSIVAVLCMCFAIVLPKVTSIVFTLSIYIVGHALGGVREFLMEEDNVLPWLIGTIELVLPAFYRFSIKDHVIYGQEIAMDTLLVNAGYGVVILVILSAISCMIFNQRDLA